MGELRLQGPSDIQPVYQQSERQDCIEREREVRIEGEESVYTDRQ